MKWNDVEKGVCTSVESCSYQNIRRTAILC